MWELTKRETTQTVKKRVDERNYYSRNRLWPSMPLLVPLESENGFEFYFLFFFFVASLALFCWPGPADGKRKTTNDKRVLGRNMCSSVFYLLRDRKIHVSWEISSHTIGRRCCFWSFFDVWLIRPTKRWRHSPIVPARLRFTFFIRHFLLQWA